VDFETVWFPLHFHFHFHFPGFVCVALRGWDG
jgi:hypothetical protein